MLRSRVFGQLVLMVVLALMAGVVSADTQNVVPSPLSQSAAGAGVPVDFTVVYSTTPSQETTGIGVRVHFDSTELAPLNGGGAGFRTGTFNPNGSLTGCQAPAVESGMAVDSDPDTDMFTACAWADLNPDDDAEGDPGEPGELWPAGPSNLFTLHFLTTADHDGSFVNFTTSGASASCPGGCEFAPTPFQVTAPGSPTPSNTPTISPTPSITLTPSITPTPSNTPTITNTPIASATPSVIAPKIPTLSGTGLALMVLLLLGIAAIYLARQRN